MIEFKLVRRFGKQWVYPDNQQAAILLKLLERNCFDPEKFCYLSELGLHYTIRNEETKE